jgi:hypothetical protein
MGFWVAIIAVAMAKAPAVIVRVMFTEILLCDRSVRIHCIVRTTVPSSALAGKPARRQRAQPNRDRPSWRMAAVMLSSLAEVAVRSWMACVVIVVLQAVAPAAGQITDTDASRIASSGSDFRFSGEPVVLGGTSYYPSGPTVFFDGAVMVRSSSFKGVPIYVDGTRDPYNIVYVPIGGKLMRPYERRRTDQVADTLAPPPATAPAEVEEATGESAVAQAPPGDRQPPSVRPPTSGNAVSAVPPGANRGIWIVFDNKVWILAGRQPYVASFTSDGTYHGFRVYRNPTRPGEIYVSSGVGDFVARYTLEASR